MADCPSCGSNEPFLHPATGPCPDAFHALPLRANGVGRLAAPADPVDAKFAERVLEVYFTRRLTDDEMRAFHDFVRGFSCHTGRDG